MKIGIHIYRRDLRTNDNLALNTLSKEVDQVVPIFIFNNKQIVKTKENKHYFSARAARFIIDSVLELNDLCDNNLCIFYGNPVHIVSELIKCLEVEAISFNLDYSKYALERDEQLINLINKNKIKLITCAHDLTLSPLEKLIKNDSTPYMVYGAFYKNACKTKVDAPQTKKITFCNMKSKIKKNDTKMFYLLSTKSEFMQKEYKDLETTLIGGRSNGLKNLKEKKRIEGFKNRDILTNQSFEISAHLNFGCLSIREVYAYFTKHKIEAVKELYWRDFFVCILKYAPNANEYKKPIDPKFNKINWRNFNKQFEKEWEAFINYKTGYVLIDAGMKQLVTTGYIGNRMRLLLATFWTKYLMIDPFDEEYGAQCGYSRYLTDCVASQNKLNHQWVTSELDLSGRRFAMKKQPPISGRMIRIDNEIITKYDPEFIYIKQWLPEHKDKTKKDFKDMETIFEWKERYQEYCSRIKA